MEGLPTKSMVLSSKITKRMSENLHHRYIDCLISDLITKDQPCPTFSDSGSGMAVADNETREGGGERSIKCLCIC